MAPVPKFPIKTCVLGVGLAGLAFHVPFVIALPELFTLHAVFERNPQSEGGKVHDRFRVTTRIHRTIEDVCADPDIQLVIVGTPNETHYAYAKAALEAGKHGAPSLHPVLSEARCIICS
jgi:predicted dehydrogenase